MPQIIVALNGGGRVDEGELEGGAGEYFEYDSSPGCSTALIPIKRTCSPLPPYIVEVITISPPSSPECVIKETPPACPDYSPPQVVTIEDSSDPSTTSEVPLVIDLPDSPVVIDIPDSPPPMEAQQRWVEVARQFMQHQAEAIVPPVLQCSQCTSMIHHDQCGEAPFLCSEDGLRANAPRPVCLCFDTQHPVLAIDQVQRWSHLDELREKNILLPPQQGRPMLGYPYSSSTPLTITVGKRRCSLLPLPYGGVVLPGTRSEYGFGPFVSFPGSISRLHPLALSPSAFLPVVAFGDGYVSYEIRVWLKSLGYTVEPGLKAVRKRHLLAIYEAAKLGLRVHTGRYRMWWRRHHRGERKMVRKNGQVILTKPNQADPGSYFF